LTLPLDASRVRAILLDIEGTTTPVDFVFRTLFPYARGKFEDYLRRHREDPGVRADLEWLRKQYRADEGQGMDVPPWRGESVDQLLASAAVYGRWLMDRDSKVFALKLIQGKIWEEGYRGGELHGEVFPDVPPAFERWSRQGRAIAIYSSGSILAQKLLFGSTAHGDLTPHLRAYFDTTTGPKADAESYKKITVALALPASEILFISDAARELDAARRSDMQTMLCVRSASDAKSGTTHPVIHTFDEVFSS
jgi:enolase-phosphatase E1